MQNLYLDQLVLSSSEVADSLRRTGLDFNAWPQSVLPDEMIQSLDAGTESDIEMLVQHDAEIAETLEQYRAERLAENRAPRPLLRTSWGLLIGEKTDTSQEGRFSLAKYRAEVHCPKGWNNPALDLYCDACMCLLSESLSEFMKRNRTVEIGLEDAPGDGLFELSVFISRQEQLGMEEKVSDGLLRYLIQIFEDGTMDRVIKTGCALSSITAVPPN